MWIRKSRNFYDYDYSIFPIFDFNENSGDFGQEKSGEWFQLWKTVKYAYKHPLPTF